MMRRNERTAENSSPWLMHPNCARCVLLQGGDDDDDDDDDDGGDDDAIFFIEVMCVL